MEKEIKKKTCYVYDRVSDQKQAKYGYSIEAQSDKCVNYGEEHDFVVLKIFEDKGETGTNSDRPDFQKMLTECEEHPVDAIIVYNTDRFARNETDHFLLREKLKKLGTQLISVSQPMIDESPEGRLLDTVLAGVNAFASRDNGRKTKNGMWKRWDMGWWNGLAPPGYLNVDKDGHIKGKRNNLERQTLINSLGRHPNPIGFDPLTKDLMKDVFNLFSTGSFTCWNLGLYMFNKGLKTKTGKPLSHSSIYQILTNPFYYGWLKAGKNVQGKMGMHEPLITKELFDLCQLVLSKHGRFVTRERKYDYLLRGFIYCSKCGQRYTAEPHPNHSKKKRIKILHYYHCQKRVPCDAPYADAAKLEKQVADYLKDIKFSKSFVDSLTIKIRNYLEGLDSEVENKRRVYLNKRSAILQQRSLLEGRLLDKNYDFNNQGEVFNRLHQQLEIDLKNIEVDITKLDAGRSFNFDLLKEILDLTRNIPRAYKKAPKFLKKRYLGFFFNKIMVEDKMIVGSEYSPLVQELVNQKNIILHHEKGSNVD